MFVVTGASGKLGRLAVQHLIERVDASRVVALTRTPEKIADLGVRVRAADFGDPDSLVSAFDGAERVLIISTDAMGQRVQQHTNAINAAAKAGVGHVLYTSLTRADEPGNPLVLVPEHRETERVLAQSGLEFTVLRNNIYPDMLLMLAPLNEAVRTGVLEGANGEGHVSYITRSDCAAAAAAVLAEGGHTGQFLEITGPEAVDYAGIAAALGEATGRAVRFEKQTKEEAAAAFAARGVEPAMIAAATQFWGSVSEGWLDVTTHAVERLTGRRPASLAEFFAARREALLG
ncbi:SDR family oxidoreductase [Streptomyces abikoensis]|uniref:SDR family oxidoreductase n=1 Tax=Streptomyces abikoensis TaxID=97398 RepID=UPI0033EDCE16